MSAPTTLAGGRVTPAAPTGTPHANGSGGEISTARLRLPCRAGDADLFFSESPAELERAKLLCAECPIRAECLAGALERGEPWGVWGGEIFEHGAVVTRKRGRGRPRKNPSTAARRGVS